LRICDLRFADLGDLSRVGPGGRVRVSYPRASPSIQVRFTGRCFVGGRLYRPPFPRKEPSPLKQAVHTAAHRGSVDGLRFRCTPSPAVPTQGTLPAEAGRPCRSRTAALWTGCAFDAPHRPPFLHEEPSPLKRAVHTACAPRFCGRAALSMHPIARRFHTRSPPR